MDFEEDAKIDVSEEKLKELSKLATQQLMIEQEIENKKAELDGLNKVLRSISEIKIPEAMQKIGMSEFALTNGAKIKVKPFYSGNLSEKNPRAAEGYEWLRKNGFGALIKKELSLDFGQMENVDWAYLMTKIKELIRESEGNDLEHIELTEGVHHATLNAFLKEQIEGGKELPLELFNAYIGNRAKISLK
jgi:hypothetical protein